MPGKLNLKYNDAGGQPSTVGIVIASLTAGTFDGVVGTDGEIDDLRDAIAGLTIGELDGVKVIARDSDSGSAKSSTPEARRELKWLVTYEDDVTLKQYQIEIPCPDITNADLVDGTEGKNAVLSEAEWVAFITAFEVVARSPTGAAVTTLSAREVGRNL